MPESDQSECRARKFNELHPDFRRGDESFSVALMDEKNSALRRQGRAMKTIKARLLALRSFALLAIIVLSAAGFYGLSERKLWLDKLNAKHMLSREPAANEAAHD